MRCSGCGSDNAAEALYCGSCGAALGERCVNCGNPLAGQKRFCSACGAAQHATCPRCGKDYPANTRFCGQCGLALKDAHPTPPAGPQPAPATGATPARKESGPRRLLAFVCILFVVALATATFAVPYLPGLLSKPGVLAVAVGVDGAAPGLSGYVGDPARAPFRPAPGTYYVEAVDASGYVITLGTIGITDGESVSFPASFRDFGGRQDPQRARELKTLVTFLADAELARLTVLGGMSGEFTVPLFDASAPPTPAQLARLQEYSRKLAAEQNDVMSALASLDARASLDGGVDYASIGPLPPAGVFGKIKDKLLGFFGYAGGAGARARDRIVKIAAQLNPEDRADAFQAIRPAFRDGTSNLDEFLARLRTGALDNQAAQIESDMHNAPGFGAEAKIEHVSVGELFHDEGAELVTRGANLEVQVIKTTLGEVFPDISDGFDMADKAAEWAKYAEEFYHDPLSHLEGAARDKAKAEIAAKIKANLAKSYPDLQPSIADKIAKAVSDRMVDALPRLAPAAGGETPEAAATATTPPAPTDTPVPPTPTAVRRPATPTVARNDGPYSIFLLTNVSGGALYLGTADSLKNRTRCSFDGGGINCKPTDLVTTKVLDGPFTTEVQAQRALCKDVTERKYMPLGVGLKGRWQGGDAWYGLWDGSVGFDCQSVS